VRRAALFPISLALGVAIDLAAGTAGAGAPRYARSVEAYAAPRVTLVDMHGAPVPLAAELEREGPVLLQFGFTTCPAVCPALAGTFAALERRLPGARLISISIDPEQDTPARLKTYAARLHAGRRWRFLTGAPEDVIAVQRAFDAWRGDKMRHEPLVFLRASPRQPWVRLTGFPSPADLEGELRRLVVR
jgi:protein SCO1